jgi:lysophospholipase L1-like esterase
MHTIEEVRMRMKVLALAGLAALVVASVHAQAPQPAGKAQPKGPNPARWENTIKAFEGRARQAPVVFIGSSTIRRWNLTEYFPGLNSINFGFGGSEMADLAAHGARLVVPIKPNLIVMYSGNNDLERGEKPEVVAQSFIQFIDAVQKDLPKVRIVMFSMKPQPTNMHDIANVRRGNELLEAAARQRNVVFLDTFKALLNEQGGIRPELYVADGTHLTPAGYQIFVKLLQPHLTQGATTN